MQQLPRRQRRQRHGGGFCGAQTRRFDADQIGVHGLVLGKTSGAGHIARVIHRIAHGNMPHRCAGLHHRAAGIKAQNGNGRVFPRPRQQALVGRVDGGGVHPHQHILLAHRRQRYLNIFESKAVVAVNHYRVHRNGHCHSPVLQPTSLTTSGRTASKLAKATGQVMR